MAAAVEIQKMLDKGFEYIPVGTTVTPSGERFNEILDKEYAVQNSKQSFTMITDDKDVKLLCEQAVMGALNGNLDTDILTADFLNLTAEQKVEVMSILQQIISYAKNESYALCPSGKTQDFVNRLFNANGSAKDILTGNALDMLKNGDDKKLSEISAAGVDLSSIFAYTPTAVGVIENGVTTSADYNTLALNLMTAVSEMVDVPVKTIFKNYDSSQTAAAAALDIPIAQNLSQNIEDYAVTGYSGNGVVTYASDEMGEFTAKLLADNEILKTAKSVEINYNTAELREIANIPDYSQIEDTEGYGENIKAQVIPEVKSLISSLSQNDSKVMVMKLNPENLGQIAIKVVDDAGKITVSIASQTEITRQLLEKRLPELIEALRNVTEKEITKVEVLPQESFTEYQSFNQQREAGQNSYYPQQSSYYYSEDNTSEEEKNSKEEVIGFWQTA